MEDPITERLSELDKRLTRISRGKKLKGGDLWDDIKEKARKGIQASAQAIQDRFEPKKGGKIDNEDKYIFKNVASDLIKSAKIGGKKVKSSVKITKAKKDMYYQKPLLPVSEDDEYEDANVSLSDLDESDLDEEREEMHILPYYDFKMNSSIKPIHHPELGEIIGMKMKGKGNIKWDDIIRII